MGRDEISLRRFRWLLDQRGYTYVAEEQLETVLTVRAKRPDFFVDTRKGVRFLVEVESFEKETVLRSSGPGFGAIDPMNLQKRINRAVRNAAEQLEPYASENLPLVVVLDNHRQVGLQIARIELIELFGRLQYAMTIDTRIGRAVSEGWEQADENFPLASGRRPYISVVLVNIPEVRFDTLDAPDEFAVPRPMRVHTIHNPDTAHPLPLCVFSGPKDKQIVRHDDQWVEFEGPPIIATAWANGRGDYGIRIGREDRDRHFKREWGIVTLLVAGRAPIVANIDKDSFWTGRCLELIDVDIKKWLADRKLIPWRPRRPPKFALIPAGDGQFLLRDWN